MGKQTTTQNNALNLEYAERFRNINKEIQTRIFERNDELKLVSLAMLSNNHVYFLGEPGTSKSELIKSYVRRIQHARYFETMLRKDSTTEQLFGPLKISALREDRYEHALEGHFADAHFAVLDEVFKGNSTVLNAALNTLNEREFSNGKNLVKVPLITALAASNELPQEDDLGAFYDRLVIRKKTVPLVEKHNRIAMMKSGPDTVKTTISVDEILAAQQEAAKVVIPDLVYEAMDEIYSEARNEGLRPSNRRLRQAVAIVKAHAYYMGRSTATMADLWPLQFIFWDQENEIEKVAEIVAKRANPHALKAKDLTGKALGTVVGLEDLPEAKRPVAATEALGAINKAKKDLEKIRAKAEDEGHDTDDIDQYLERVANLREQVKDRYLKAMLGE